MKIIFLLLFFIILIFYIKNLKSYNIENFESLDTNSKLSFPIYWINLDRSKDRKLLIENQFKKYGITNHTRIPAVDGSNIEKLIINKIRNENKWNAKLGEIGCYLSHCEALKKINENDKILILEDDIVISDNFIENFNNSVKELPEKWDILLIGFRFHQPSQNIDYSKNLQKTKSRYFGAHAYLINKSFLSRINNICDLNKIKKPIDLLFSDLVDKLLIFNTKKELISANSHLKNETLTYNNFDKN